MLRNHITRNPFPFPFALVIVIVIGLVSFQNTARGQEPGKTDRGQMGQMWGQQMAKMTKYWNGMVFGPKTFKETAQTNPDAKPNPITISAYSPSLSDSELVEIAVAKVQSKWGKRGDVGLYFPAGIKVGEGKSINFVFGKDAEKYIKDGNLLRGFATVGMPVDDIGSANWAKNVAVVNVGHAISQAKKSRVFRRALAKIGQQNPQLKRAAQKFDLSNAGLQQALMQRAQNSPALAKAMGTMMQQIAMPMGFVVNAGFNDNDDGALHYAIGKRRANEAKRASGDKIVAKKVGDLMFSWWMKVLPKAKETNPRIFDANHCAGVFDASDWTFHLKARLKREAPGKLRKVMNRTYAYDFGAGANRPVGVHHLVRIGARDMFGQLNTPTEVMKRAKMSKSNHMTNTLLGKLNPDQLPALEIRPFASAFGLRLYDGTTPKRGKLLSTLTTHYKNMVRQQVSVLKDLQKNSPNEDKLWPTYKMAEANLRGHKAVYEARGKRAAALSKILSLRKSGASKSQIKAVWTKVKQARKSERDARAKMQREISTIGLGRNMMTDATQYQAYIHGGQDTAKQKFLEKRFEKDPAAAKAYMARAKLHGKAFEVQITHLYGRAMAAMKFVRGKLNPSSNRGQPAAGRPGGQARRIPVRR